MILVDDRTGSKELAPIIQRLGAPCEIQRLEYGDACFGGNGPHGPISIGIERKTLNDMLQCIEDARYSAHQRPGMLAMYSKSFLMLEGLWSCGDGNGFDGVLMQGYRRGQSWGPLQTRSTRRVLYTKLFNYMASVALSGVIITYPTDIIQTAIQIVSLYGYFQKPWARHTSLIETQKLAIPCLAGKPSLVRRWAHEIDDIGATFAEEAERLFKVPIRLAAADATDWESIKGIGHLTANRIVGQIRGTRK